MDYELDKKNKILYYIASAFGCGSCDRVLETREAAGVWQNVGRTYGEKGSPDI